jgi:hypothetical protein
MRPPRPRWSIDTIARVDELLTAGVKPAEVAHRTGVTISTVRRASQRLKEEEEHRAVPRCRCGLALPCNDCLPARLHDFIATRMRSEAGT